MEVVGKIERSALCDDCQVIVESGTREVWLCNDCSDEHGADIAVAVNSSKANLLVEEVSDERLQP